MKKINTLMIVLAALTVAQDATAISASWSAVAQPVQNVLCDIYVIFWEIIGVLGVVVMLAAAVQWIMSRDDASKRKQAQDIVVAVIIGLIIAVIAKSLIDAVASSFDTLEPFACTTTIP